MHSIQPLTRWTANKKINPLAQGRIIVFPCACAGATYFREWHALCPAGVDFIPVQLPGRESRFGEKRFEKMETLIPVLAEALQPLWDKPFVFFGHSLGALISYELTCFLQEHGQPLPAHLFVAAYRAPHLENTRPILHTLPDEAFMQELIDYQGMPAEIVNQPELLRLLTPIAKSDFALHETYAYSARDPLALPVTVFGGIDDIYVTQAMLEAWEECSAKAFRLMMLPGNHYFINDHKDRIMRELVRPVTV